MLGGPVLTRPRVGSAGEGDKEGSTAVEAAMDVGSTGACRGILTEITAAITAESAPPITTI